MKLLFENWREYLLLSEAQILIEGRISDTAKKYPELAKKRKELDGMGLLDVLINADPSDNQKYLMGAARLIQQSMEANQKRGLVPFWGIKWPEDASDDIYSPWGIAKNTAELLPKYHKLMVYIRDQDAPFKDINNIKTYTALQSVINTARGIKANQDLKKKVEEELKKTAKESTEFVKKTPYHLVIRPLSTEASCYWGRGAPWCISATKSKNYFDSYTRDGKAFFFLLAKRKEIDPDYKKIAVVIDRDGEFEEYFDINNKTMYLQEFMDAVSQAITGVPIQHEIASMEEGEPHDTEIIRKGLEPFNGKRGFDFDANDDIREVAALFHDTFLESYIDELKEAGIASVEKTPMGTPDIEYEEELDSRNFNQVNVGLSFPDETGLELVGWESGVSLDVERTVNRAAADGWMWVTDEGGTSKWTPHIIDEGDIHSAVVDALNAVGIYPERIEQDSDDPYSFYVMVDYGEGSLYAFQGFLNSTETHDKDFTAGFTENLLAQLEDLGIIANPKKVEAEQEKVKAEQEKVKAEQEAEYRKIRDAEYWPNPEEKKKQLDLRLQENKIKIRVRRQR